MLKRLIKNFLKLTQSRSKTEHIPPPLKSINFGQFCSFTIIGSPKSDIGNNVAMRSFCNITLYPDSNIIIDDNVFFNNYCSINCLEYIEIGKNTLFGEGVKIYDHNHRHGLEKEKLVVARDEFSTAPIKIGSDCWIGSNVTILKGVKIGNNVIVGANNLIYKSIPSNSIVKANTSFNLNSYDV